MPRVVHFEIQASDPDRALRFYQAVFGWESKHWPGDQPYWLLTTGPAGSPGIDGGVFVRRGEAPSADAPTNAYVCIVDVPLVEEALQNVELAGGRVVTQKVPVPGLGWLAYARDPEGNLFGVMQADPEAR